MIFILLNFFIAVKEQKTSNFTSKKYANFQTNHRQNRGNFLSYSEIILKLKLIREGEISFNIYLYILNIIFKKKLK